MSTESVKVQWLESPPHYNYGTTFGLPWERGKYKSNETEFTCTTPDGRFVPLQSWNTAYWPDDSIKWTAHATPAGETSEDGYIVHATVKQQHPHAPKETLHQTIRTQISDESIIVDTGEITVTFPKSGSSPISSIVNKKGTTIATNTHLVLLTQSAIPDDSDIPSHPITHAKHTSTITSTTTEHRGPLRLTIKTTGHHQQVSPASTPSPHPTLPFTLRTTLHASSPLLRLTHTLIYAYLPSTTPHIRALALRLTIPPLATTPPWNHHIRLTTAGGGVHADAAQGLTGLWADPGEAVRRAQADGRAAPPRALWGGGLAQGARWVPVWRAWRLGQPGPDGFGVSKRTGEGRAWVRAPGGTRAGGVVYLGAAGVGGVALGVRYFWERWPTGLEGRAGEGEGEVTAWLWCPEAGPMDVRPWHGGEGQSGYDEQLEAMRVTYEDWEEGMGSPEGVARTNELFLLATEGTPEGERLAELTKYVRNPPVLVADSERIYRTGALGTYWSPASHNLSASRVQQDVERRLDFLFNFYKGQVEQRKWYGFWDHGDIMHTYDADRHTWRYDVGGYAWDNSELSPDLWLWLYFLRTGRADVYRMAEALTKHTGEVDVYHLGKYKGLGTRHGVQHWGDSCKQARISNALYRRFFYYLSGGDERTGDLLEETLETENTFLTLDPYRKVRKDRDTYKPNPRALTISLGTDWSALAAGWFIEWERRGERWEDARRKLLATMSGISALKNGFVTGQVSYSLLTGEISPPLEDPGNGGVVKVSHLSAMFGLFEICAELLDLLQTDVPAGFKDAWLEYCRYFNATSEEQTKRFGVSFGKLQLQQGHSRLTAYGSRAMDTEMTLNGAVS
ncbi:secreted protein [Neofusicoccum parvum]|uniref:Secreted protein n=1 Tax=Neofusicoccum parvum TaxID=310453 RepID=A0ACB5RTE4_9PEZI|nr:secreted protein [Neofusicoccum parvum]